MLKIKDILSNQVYALKIYKAQINKDLIKKEKLIFDRIENYIIKTKFFHQDNCNKGYDK